MPNLRIYTGYLLNVGLLDEVGVHPIVSAWPVWFPVAAIAAVDVRLVRENKVSENELGTCAVRQELELMEFPIGQIGGLRKERKAAIAQPDDGLERGHASPCHIKLRLNPSGRRQLHIGRLARRRGLEPGREEVVPVALAPQELLGDVGLYEGIGGGPVVVEGPSITGEVVQISPVEQ